MTTKICLTDQHIDDILNFITPNPYIPEETANSIVDINKKSFRKQLIDREIYEELIPELKTELEKQYLDSIINPGESVGIICAQSIGEKNTQTTLNTFHKAGQSEKTMTTGFPRFQELINVSKNPSIINHKIYLNKKVNTIQEIRNIVNNKIVGLTLKDVMENFEIYVNKPREDWYTLYEKIYDKPITFTSCITIYLNINKIYKFKLDLVTIAKNIEKEYDDLHVVFSPLSIGRLDIFVDISEVEIPQENIAFLQTSCVYEYYLEDYVLPNLEVLYICGIPSITEVFYIKDSRDEWIIETNSFNSKKISNNYNSYEDLLNLDIVNFEKTTSNNILDIYEILGIEATREFLINEFLEIMEGINETHVKLLVDNMTNNGNISSISRHTMRKEEVGPICKASFEETMDNFLMAAKLGIREPTIGVSSSIICGKKANIGTEMIDIEIDYQNLPSV